MCPLTTVFFVQALSILHYVALSSEHLCCHAELPDRGRHPSQSGAVRVVLVNQSDPQSGSQGMTCFNLASIQTWDSA